MIKFTLKILLPIAFVFAGSGLFGQNNLKQSTEKDYDYLEAQYIYLHSNPELSFLEEKTSAHLAKLTKELGFHVESNFGGYGVVAVMENGEGPTVLIRADMDALPVLEETGLEYASKVKMTDIGGETVSVMHACGHDVHMTVWLGTARYLSTNKDKWKGKIIMLAQPAEERSGGAKAMLKDGLYDKFGVPDYCLALHVSSDISSSHVGLCPGYAMANVDMMKIIIKGQGGHGALPHTTKDPISMAARLINDLQTIVSREISPFDPAVVTVGSIHGGAKGNVIPNEVVLELTMRSYSDKVREQIIEAIERKCISMGKGAGIPENMYPEVILRDEFTPSLYNDPDLTHRIEKVFIKELGKDNVSIIEPAMVGEDFGRFGRTEDKVPILMYRLGAAEPELIKLAKEEGRLLPSLHSSTFSPDREATIKTGVRTMTAAALDLLNN